MTALLPRGHIHVHWRPRPAGSQRSALRDVLARYLDLRPEEVSIVQDAPHDKPRLAPPFGALEFSWSHSGEHAVIAIARELAVGVDVEQVGRGHDALALARRHFAPAEVVALAAVPGAERKALFMRYWTAKEALVKASGLGLALGLAGVEVDLGRDPPRVLRAAGDATAWQLRTLATPWPGYVTSLAWRGPADAEVESFSELS